MWRPSGRVLRDARLPVLGSAAPRAINSANPRGLKLPMTFFARAGVRIFFAISLTVSALWAFAASQPQAHAGANYPDRPGRIVLPFAAGAAADITGRIVAEKLGDRIGQRFYIENQPGAAGIAAARTGTASRPHGPTRDRLA